MKGFVINLERAEQRRERCQKLFADSELELVIVPAVDGKTIELPHPNYSEKGYIRCHGKRTNPNQVACFFSHLKAIEMFLETEDEHGIIMEDDVDFGPNLTEVIALALAARPEVGCLRLAGRRNAKTLLTDQLDSEYSLGIDFTRQTGTGCYLLNRQTASDMLKHLPPMIAPIDHAFDRDWKWSGVTMRVIPFPATQKADPTTSYNDEREPEKLPAWKRYWTVFPYRAYTETRRFLHRFKSWLALPKSNPTPN